MPASRLSGLARQYQAGPVSTSPLHDKGIAMTRYAEVTGDKPVKDHVVVQPATPMP